MKMISELSEVNGLLRAQLEKAIKELRKEVMSFNDSLIRAEGELNVYRSKETMAKNTIVPTPNSLIIPTTGTTQPIAPNIVNPPAAGTPRLDSHGGPGQSLHLTDLSSWHLGVMV